ncbi:hypothetical protein PGT21_000300 [Puccinia graminis f. sp. tritici]|uniref:Chromo domain-containing protein n=1 Tax=Puccinia graminis f. sp. tritici TaxID=56615 RepID=A0A5B0NHV4_PUCGR|nr:hypothetical protein PGT21_000300 [Puccinia graminis f. sp. tritici]
MRKQKFQQQEWAANQILQEKGGKYLIEWSGLDPTTGRPWEPSWEPKKMANRALVADWQKGKHPKTRGQHSDIHLSTPACPSEESKSVSQDSHIDPRLTNPKTMTGDHGSTKLRAVNQADDLDITSHRKMGTNFKHIVKADPDLRGHQTATFHVGDNNVEITGLGFILDPHVADPKCACNQQDFVLGGEAARVTWPEHPSKLLQSQGITFV